VSTLAVAAPFDLFGNAGTGQGAQLLADALREMLDDNRRERQPARCHAYQGQVRQQEMMFEKLSDYQNCQKNARQIVQTSLDKKEFLLWFAGNHLSVLPVLEELGPAQETIVFQFDAHLDVYNLTDCATEPSHGNFLLHAQGPLPPIVHIGHRDLFLPQEHVQKHFETVISAEDLSLAMDSSFKQLRKLAKSARQVWLDIDCDVFDPAFFPAVSEPLPFGLCMSTFLQLLDALWSEKVLGISLSEFNPAHDVRDQSLGTLIWLIEYVLLKRYEG
jgi:arginase family enzyme